jgi:hypothetical protein
VADGVYRALLIGNSFFPDDSAGLPTLSGPFHDVNTLKSALTDPDCGLFTAGDVKLLVDLPKQEITMSMEHFFATARREDCLLLYYSGHGQLDAYNHLYICGRDTTTKALISTGIRSDEVNAMIRQSPARTFIVILDCCHSGRWKAGTRLPDNLKGRGRFIITSSEAGQLSADAKQADSPSPFTRHFADGLTAPMLRPDNGSYVTLDAIYRYVFERLESEGPQRPQRNFDSTVGMVPLARRSVPAGAGAPTARQDAVAPRQLFVSEELIQLSDVSPDEVLPDEIIDVFDTAGGPIEWTVESDADWITAVPRSETAFALTLRPRPGVNRGKVRVRSPAAGQTRIVRVTVHVLDREPEPRLSVEPGEIDFGLLSVGEPSPIRTVRLTNLGGGELEAVARTTAQALKLRRRGSVLELTVDTSSAGEVAANVAVKSAGGSAVVPVRALVQQGPVLMVEPRTIDLGSFASTGAERSKQRITVRNAGSGELEWDYGCTGSFFSVDRDVEGLFVGAQTPSPPSVRHLRRREGSIWVRSNGGEATVQVLADQTDSPLPFISNPGALPPAVSRVGPSRDLTAKWREAQRARAAADEERRAASRAVNPPFFADAHWWSGSAGLVLLTAAAAAAVDPLLRLVAGAWLSIFPPAVHAGPALLAAAGAIFGFRQAWMAAAWWRFDPGIGWRAIFRLRIMVVGAAWLAVSLTWGVALAAAQYVPSSDSARVAAEVLILGVLVVWFAMAENDAWPRQRFPPAASAGKSQDDPRVGAALAGVTLVLMVAAAVLAEGALRWAAEPYHLDLPDAPARWLLYVAAGAWTVALTWAAFELTRSPRNWWRLLRASLLSGWSIPTLFGAVPLNLWAPWTAAGLLGLLGEHVYGVDPHYYGTVVASLFVLLTALLIAGHLSLCYDEAGWWGDSTGNLAMALLRPAKTLLDWARTVYKRSPIRDTDIPPQADGPVEHPPTGASSG